MTSTQRIEIPLSKTKLLLMLIASLAFVALGIWLLILQTSSNEPFWAEHVLVNLTACATIVFFGICAFVLIRKLPDQGPGLIIDDQGLTDNSSGVSAGQIPWTDIEDISVLEIQRQKLIMLHIKNPQDYIDKQTSSFQRKVMNLNFKLYGSPLFISSNGLKISFDALLKVLKDKLDEIKRQNGPATGEN